MATQPKLLEMPLGGNPAAWKRYGKYLSSAHADMLWEIGDWLLAGTDKVNLEETTVQKFAAETFEKPWGTLKTYKGVSKAIPKSRRRYNLSYSIHREVHKFDEKHQELLLDIAAKGIGTHSDQTRAKMPVTFLRGRIQDMQKRGELPPAKVVAPPEQVPAKDKPRVVPVKLSVVHYALLKAVLATHKVAGTPSVQDLIKYIVYDYVQDHMDILMAAAKKHDSRWGSLKPEALETLSPATRKGGHISAYFPELLKSGQDK